MYDFVDRLPSWLRWVLTPIASVVTIIAVTFVANIAAKIFVFLSGNRGWGENFFIYLLNPGVAGFCAISVAEILAPKAKRMTAIVFAGVWIFLSGAATFVSLLNSDWKTLLSIASTVVGVGVAAMNTENSSA